MDMCPCEADSQLAKKDILKRGHKLGATDVFCVDYTAPKNDCGQLLGRV